jgi:long-chain acyl-CoA synthetase
MLANLLASALAAVPDKPAVIAGDQVWTYRQLDELSTRLAARWLGDGLEPGDRVAVLLPNRPEIVLVYLAGFKSGLIVVPLHPDTPAIKIAYSLRHSGSRLAVLAADRQQDLPEIAGHENLERAYVVAGPPRGALQPFDKLLTSGRIAALPSHIPPADPAVILYTSGTTSRPKGVTLSRHSLACCLHQWLATCPVAADDVWLISSPLGRPMAVRSQLLPALARGGTVVLLERFTPEGFLDAFRRPPSKTFISLYPSGLAQVLALPAAREADWSSVRVCTTGGDHVPPRLQQEFRAATGVEVTEQCGMTETGVYACNPPLGRKKPGSVGLPFYGVRLRLVDGEGHDVLFGETGEILVQGDTVMDGYWNDTAQTRRALRDGWLVTGDLGRFDADGYLWLVGRKKDLIVRDAWKISPREVEEVLLQHPAVAAAGVAGIEDPEHGKALVAVVVSGPDATPLEEELIRFAAARLEPVMVPERVLFADRLPTTANAKLDRDRLAWWAETGTII